MADELVALTVHQAERVQRAVEYVESMIPVGPRQTGRRPLQSAKVVIGALTSAAAATTALLGKPKVAVLNIYSFSSTGVEDTGVDENCYNFAPQAATTDRWTVCERCAITGKLIITTQFCS